MVVGTEKRSRTRGRKYQLLEIEKKKQKEEGEAVYLYARARTKTLVGTIASLSYCEVNFGGYCYVHIVTSHLGVVVPDWEASHCP
jgi:hypothetical protein